MYTNYADVATGSAPAATGSGGSFDALLALAEVGAKATAGGASQRHHAPHHPSVTPKSKQPAAVDVHSKRVGRHRRKAGPERLPPGLQGLVLVSGQSPMRAPHSTPHSNNRRGSLTGSGLRQSPSSARATLGGGASHLDSPSTSPHRSGAPSASQPPGSLSAWAAACSIDAALLIPAPGPDDAAAWAGATRVSAALHRSSRARRWAVAEWFTPVIDEEAPRGNGEVGTGGAAGGRGAAAAPAGGDRRTFSTWLAHCGLAGISHLRRVEWRAVRAALAKPRRVSLPWLREQRDSIEGERAKSRTAYGRLKNMGRLGASNLSREELPSGVPCPLAVGERVLAIHPRTRSVHPGQVLTVDVTRCRVQFDRLDLGTEAVADTSVARAHAAAGTQAARGAFSPAGHATPASARKLAGSMGSPGASRSVHFHLPHSGAPAAARALYGTQAPEAVAAVTAVAAAAAAAARGNFPGSPREAAAATAHALATASHEADVACLATLSAALDAKDGLLTQLRVIHAEAEAAAATKTELGEAFVRGHRQLLAALQDANVRVEAGLEALRARARFHDDPTGDDAAAAAAAPQSLSGAAQHGGPQDARAVANTISAAVGAALVQSAHALHSAGAGGQGARGGSGGAGNVRQWHWPGAGSPSHGADALLDASDGLGATSAAHKLLTDAAADAAQLVASCHAGLRPGGQDAAAPTGAAAPTTAAAAEAAAASMASSSGLVKGCVALLQLVRSLADSPGRVPPAHLSQVLDAALLALRPRHGANTPLFAKVAAVVADVQGILRTVYASQ